MDDERAPYESAFHGPGLVMTKGKSPCLTDRRPLATAVDLNPSVGKDRLRAFAPAGHMQNKDHGARRRQIHVICPEQIARNPRTKGPPLSGKRKLEPRSRIPSIHGRSPWRSPALYTRCECIFALTKESEDHHMAHDEQVLWVPELCA